MSFPRVLALLGVAAVLLGGCGDGGTDATAEQDRALETVYLNLDWDPGPENVGPVVATDLDYFIDAGIDILFNPPAHPERVTTYLDDEMVDAAIVREPQVVLAREEGPPLVIVGSLLPETTLAMIWPTESGIDGIADLKGKTIAYPGIAFQRVFLEHILEGAGLTLADVKLVDVRYELMTALTSGRADAIFGGSGNEEGVLLKARGLDPVVTEATDLGIPRYEELVLIARRDRYEKDPELFQRLLDASIRGNETASEDPGSAAEAIFEQSFGEAPRKPNQAGVEATAPLLSKTGKVDRAKLEALVDWMHEQGMIERKPPVSALLATP